MPDTITNGGLGKLFSLEFMGMLLLGGIAWGTLQADVATLKDEVGATEARSQHRANVDAEGREELKSDVAEIKTDIAVIKNNQKAFKDFLERRDETQNKILEILERQER